MSENTEDETLTALISKRFSSPRNLYTCIGCGCDDDHACLDAETSRPCSWLIKDDETMVGVCSACPGERHRFEQGDRRFTVPGHSVKNDKSVDKGK